MPKTKSAKKALRQNVRRRERNIERSKTLKDVLKKYKSLIAGKKMEEAASYLPQVYKALDKSAKVNLLKKNKASRLKSRLSSKLARTK